MGCSRERVVRATVAFAFTALAAWNAVLAGTAEEKQASVYDEMWKVFALYENDDNHTIQGLVLSGRFQLDYATVDADQGRDDEWNIRRFRFGAKAELFENLTVHGEIEINPQERDPFYVRFTDLYVAWRRSSRFGLTVGKHAAPFTMDGSTSSKELLALDRSNLSNNLWFPQEYIPGVSVSGKRGSWMYLGGLYTSGSINRELGEFDGSAFGLVVVGYDFAKHWRVKEALLRANYVHQGTDPDNTFTRPFANIYSLNLKLDAGPWGVRADVSAGDGYLGQSDLWGVMAMPFVNLGGELQLVGRYTYLESADPNGVRLASYESRVVSGRGDEYRELYVGLNYYFYGHKLKVQSGVDWADMEDRADDGGAYSGVSWITGLRVSW
jgi:phosphate-selective porin OprO/OprP